MGKHYALGRGVQQDFDEAMVWYQQAAEYGEPVAYLNVGLLYENGQGRPADPAEAARWYRAAAERGEPRSLAKLAHFYAEGISVTPDPVTAWALQDTAMAYDRDGALDAPEERLMQMGQQLAPQQKGEAKALAQSWQNGEELVLP